MDLQVLLTVLIGYGVFIYGVYRGMMVPLRG